MEEKKNTGGKFVIGLALLLVGVLIGIIIFYFWNEKNKTTSDNNLTITQDKESDNYIKETEDEVLIFRTNEYELYAVLSVQNGSVTATTKKYIEDKTNTDTSKINYIVDTTYKSQSKNININGEKVKYIHNFYDQPGATNVIYVLTESGNVYTNTFVIPNKEDFSVVDKFEKTKYTNVKELVKVKNDNYQKEEEISGLIDPIEYYIHVLTNDNKLSADKIGNY